MLTEPLEQIADVSDGALRRRVLIVDDDTDMAEVLSIRLGRLGYDTSIAASGSSGITHARSGKPHIVILDLRLPDIDGFEVCEQLVDDEATSEIPVIIVSGYDHPDVIRRARAAGCQYYIRKPYDPNALLTLIQQALADA
jgi:two-component system cell cycle response regulator DivK